MTNSTTPTLTAASTDPNSAPLTMYYEVAAGTNSNPPASSDVATGSVNATSNGQEVSWTVPAGALTSGSTYEWRVKACHTSNSSICSVYPSWVVFTVDTTPPPAASFQSNSTPNGYTTQDSGTVFWTHAGDTADEACYFDGAPCTDVTTPQNGTANYAKNIGGVSHVDISHAGGGEHELEVDTYDLAGNTTSNFWDFIVGSGLVASPSDQGRTQQYVPLSGEAPNNDTWTDFFYRVGNTASYQLIPISDLSLAGTNHQPLPSGTTWPLNMGASPWTTGVIWNMMSSAGGQDGLVQVYACYYTSQTRTGQACSPTNNVQLTTHAFGESNATRTVGPGTVALLTGDYSVSATDVNVPSYKDSLTLGRTFTTLAPTTATAAAGVFGPGWRASFYGPNAGHADAAFVPNLANGTVTLVDADGTEELYQGTNHGAGSVFTGVADNAADGSTITENSATQFTLKEADGTQTVYSNPGGVWGVTQVVEASGKPTATTTTYTLDASGRVTQILAPIPDGVGCATPATTPGCRTLQFSYATTTTATANSFGDYAGQLSSVSFMSYDPAAGAMANGGAGVVVERYAYDTTGHLRQAWDPRISPNLVTAYSYDSNGRLATVTPPGLATTTLGYDSQGRVRTISHPDPSGPTSTSTIVYGDQLPIDATGPINMTPAQTGMWGEGGSTPSTSTPTTPITAAAVFNPDHVPTATPTSSDWPYAQLIYLDVNGREVNTAAYGNGAWQIGATQYDGYGNAIWSITPGNLAQAATPTAATDPAVAALPTEAKRASALATISNYSADGTELIITTGPTHPVSSPGAGGLIDGRERTVNTYDEGAPGTGGPYRLVTTSVHSVRAMSGTTDYDAVTTKSGYAALVSGDVDGWTLHKPTSTTTIMAGGTSLTSYTRYNNAGQVIETRQPMGAASGGAGSDAYTTRTTYYTATGTGSCVSAALAGLTCSVGPAAQPTTGKHLPVTTTTYNLYDEPLVATETVGSVTRTTTTSYDTAGRKIGTQIVVSPAGADGADLPAQTFGYDPATGLATTTSDTTGKSVTTGYDSLGRVHTYTDATGALTTTSYDVDGRVAVVTDPNGSATYTYDGSAGEHRGLLTSITDSLAGAFSGSYDNDGNLATQTYPGGLVATYSYDNSGASTAVTYAENGVTWLGFTAQHDSQGRIASATNAAGASTAYSYDNAGRLVTAVDNNGTTCNRRSYGYNNDTDRTSLATSSYPTSGGACTGSGTPTTVNHSYDQADRLTDAGYTYDDFGRTLTVPNADASGQGPLTLGYYTSDLVRTITGTVNGQSVTKTYGLDPTLRVLTESTGTPPTVPGAPTGVIATAGDSQAVVSWTPPATNGGSPITGYTVTASPGGATATTTGGLSATVTGLTDGTSYTFTVTASNTVGTGPASVASPAITPAVGGGSSPSPIVVDAQVSQDSVVKNQPITSPAFSTTHAGDVLVAFVTFATDATGLRQTASVTGGGLTWSPVSRANLSDGTSEIWTATASSTLSGATVTATASQVTSGGSLTVLALSGAAGVGASGYASAGSGAPSVRLTTTAAGSWVLATGNDWDGATPRTLASGQTMVHEYSAVSSGDDYWVQASANPVSGSAGTSVTMADVAPTSDEWNLAAVEVVAAGGTGAGGGGQGSIAVDGRASADYFGSSKTITVNGLSTTKPGDLLVAYVNINSLAAGQTASVSGAGLSWSLASRANASPGDSEIWTASAPAALSNVSVSATGVMTSDSGSVTVVAYAGASGVGATSSGAGGGGAPHASLTTTAAGSLVVGVGNDWEDSIARTLAAGQSLIHEYRETVDGNDYWAQATTNPVAAAGSVVTIADTAPTSTEWNLAVAEVTAQAAVAPGAPTGVAAAPGDGAAAVWWTAPARPAARRSAGMW